MSEVRVRKRNMLPPQLLPAGRRRPSSHQPHSADPMLVKVTGLKSRHLNLICSVIHHTHVHSRLAGESQQLSLNQLRNWAVIHAQIIKTCYAFTLSEQQTEHSVWQSACY